MGSVDHRSPDNNLKTMAADIPAQSDPSRTTPLITVITVNWNNRAGLETTLASVREQTFTDFEHVVVDGLSTDGSVAVLEAEGGTRVRWISERDSGVYQAMNKGVRLANGRYLVFLNSGDHFVSTSSLEQAAKHVDGRDLYYFDLEIRRPNAAGEIDIHTKSYPRTLSFSYFARFSLPHPSSLIRRELFEQFGLYDEELKICSDWKAFMLWVCKFGCSYQYVPVALSVFYMDGLSSKPENQELIADERARVWAQELPAFVPDLPLLASESNANETLILVRSSRWIRALQSLGLLWKF